MIYLIYHKGRLLKMDLHLDLNDEELEYLEEMGIPAILTDSLTKCLKNVVLTKPPDLMLALAEKMASPEKKQQKTIVQGMRS